MSPQEVHRTGLYYVIIAPVMEDERLEHSEIVFYALLSGLASNHGYCFASDKYLAERMRSKDRTVRDWLKRLEEFGYIRRETNKVGMAWERKIYVLHGISKNNNERHSTAGSSGTSAYRSGAPVPDRAAPQCRIEGKEINIESEVENITPPTPKGEPLTHFGKHVKLKEEEYRKLCETHSQGMVDSCIEKINDYISAHGKKGYKDYAAAVRNWLKNADYKKSIPTQAVGLKSFFDRFKEVYEGHKHITIGNGYVEFDCGPAVPSDYIKFDEHGAQERIENRLRKMGIYEKSHFS